MSATFEWDEKKAKANRKKHKIAFEEGATIFNDPLIADMPDSDHSETEPRQIAVGHSVKKHLLVVIYTERNDNIRIISCRKATPAERKIYEENKSENTQ
ncbi:MAG: BrnT family toxin [Chloroflexi bacterium]|nr:BrnT family toxin [Chloroflexota bacterium]MBI5080549.1 BrnT family toxin [Chloroflexota bacterium]MBI5348472.1 BrnT family toxin [Chloroflexota bacterium]